MLRFATLLASVPNPGPYHPPIAPPAIGDAGWGMLLGFLLLVTGVLVVAGGHAIWTRARDLRPVAIFVVVLGVAGAVGGGSWFVTSREAIVRANDKAEQVVHDYDTRYDASVKQWLADDYGVATNDGSLTTLIRGGQLVAATKAGQQMIQLAPTTDDKLAVQVVGGAVLQPNVPAE